MASSRYRIPLWLLVVAAASISHVSSRCDPVENPGEGDNAIPDFFNFFAGEFTLMLEMTEVNNNHTNYAKHSHYVKKEGGDALEEDAVTMYDDGAYIVYHYFGEEQKFIEQFDEACIEPDEEHPMYIPSGWLDEDMSHGMRMYGPATILRSTHTQKARYDGTDFDIDGIKCERWYVCINEETEIDFYFSQRDVFDMPEKDLFQDEKIANRLPVMYEVIPEDTKDHIRYTVVNFLPHLLRHANIETPRGLACEDKISIDPSKVMPKIPSHFSLAEEVILNPFIGGQQFGIGQLMEKYEFKYSEYLSMVRLDATPLAEEKEDDQFPDKVIHDFNTGVQYAINRKYGKCKIERIPPYSFDEHHSGFIGGFGQMASPDQLFHIDDTYSYVGPRDTRALKGDLFTSTRTDIPDPEFEFIMNFPKAVLEYYFSQGREVSPHSNSILTSIPTRADLFIYNKTDPLAIMGMSTTNLYDAKEVNFYTTDEYSVTECYDKHDDDWSSLYLFFPANEAQFLAESANEQEFKHHVFYYLLELGDISPTRVGSIDVMDGTSGWYSNTSDTDTIMVSVKLMERAPYFYGYRIPDDPFQVPGDDEKGLDAFNKEGCAEACTLEENFECKSFHYCEGVKGDVPCYLSNSEGAWGNQTKNYTCMHYIDNHENATFVDLPSSEVDGRLKLYIQEKKFNFTIKYGEKDVIFTASEHIMFKTPDPLDPIRSQFSLYERYHTISKPDFVFDLKDHASVACMSACLDMIDFKCEAFVHYALTGACRLYADRIENINSTRIDTSLDAYIYTRSYLSDYKPLLGGVSLNTTGPVFRGYSPEECAWRCTHDSNDTFSCNSFEYCWEEEQCHLHVETFVDVSDGGNYSTHQKCIHFEKKAEEIFTRYPNEGMPNSDHKLVAQLTGVSACAKLCIEDSSETCQSFDFCAVCEEEDWDVCGEDNKKGLNMCFIGDHHIGEPGLKLSKATHCEHYSRDLFGDQDYASWIASQRKSQKPYTGGSMAGIAFGMIFLGIILAAGFLFVMSRVRPGTLPDSISLGERSSTGLPRSSGGRDTSVNFGNLKAEGGESDI